MYLAFSHTELLILFYLAAINLFTFVLFGIDKSAARKQRRRISERALYSAMLAGGAIGAWTGMSYFRHKTKKCSFEAIALLLLLLELSLVFFFLSTYNA